MKKINIILVICLSLVIMTVPASAVEIQGNIYTEQNATVMFDADSSFTLEEQQHITELLVYGEDTTNPYGLSCTLFGHNYESEIVTLINHRVRTTAPRCLEEKYKVSKCSKCGDTQQTLLSASYINCCS